MERLGRYTRRGVLLLVLGSGAWVLLSGLYRRIGSVFQMDFSEEPPKEAFRVAFGRPPPAGVTNLRAAGMRGLGGMSVWLRFHATEPIIRELTGSLKPESAKEALEEQREVLDHNLQHFDPEDRLRWRELYRILQLQAYEAKRDTWGYLEVFVDRPGGDVFVFVFGT